MELVFAQTLGCLLLSALLLLTFFSIAPAKQVNIRPGLLKFTVSGTIDEKNSGMIDREGRIVGKFDTEQLTAKLKEIFGY